MSIVRADLIYVLDLNSDDNLGSLISGSGIVASSFHLDIAYLTDNIVNIKARKSNDDSLEIIRSKLTFTWDEKVLPTSAASPAHAISDTIGVRPTLGAALVGLAILRRSIAH